MGFFSAYNTEIFRKIKGAWKQGYFEKTGFSFTSYVNWRHVSIWKSTEAHSILAQ